MLRLAVPHNFQPKGRLEQFDVELFHKMGWITRTPPDSVTQNLVGSSRCLLSSLASSLSIVFVLLFLFLENRRYAATRVRFSAPNCKAGTMGAVSKLGIFARYE